MAGSLGRGDEGLRQSRLFLHHRERQRPAPRAQGMGWTVEVFQLLEVGQNFLEAPAGAAALGPTVVVLLLAPDVDHAVDERGAAEAAAPGNGDPAIVGRLFRLAPEAPVPALVDEQLAEARRDRNPEAARLAAGLQQQHPVPARSRQAVGQHAARGAAAHDDVVELAAQGIAPMWRAMSSIWASSIGRPNWMRQPTAWAACSSGVIAGSMIASATTWSACSRAVSSGRGSSARMPREVPLTISSWSSKAAASAVASTSGKAVRTRAARCSALSRVRLETVSRLIPASASAKAMAEEAPPAPHSQTLLPAGSTPAWRKALTKPIPSSMAPTIRPSASRRTMLAAPMSRAWSSTSSQSSTMAGLCGTVAMKPPKFRICLRPAIISGSPSGETWIGTSTPSTPWRSKTRCMASGVFT